MEKLSAGEKTLESETTSSTSHTKETEQHATDVISKKTNAEAAASSCNTAEPKEKTQQQDDDKLSLISWNVDGLDGVHQPERARALYSYLTKFSPDVVFLQEIIQPYARFLHHRLAANYNIIQGGDEGYFTMMLLKKSRITLERSGTVDFPATHMMRNLLVARVLFKDQKFCLMTSHFESCKVNAPERKRQLQLVMRRMNKAHDDVTVLFGGDTNLRDAEVAEVGLPSGICDVWEQLGKPENCSFTWDTEVNTNKVMEFKNRFRFDRVYLRQATARSVPKLEPDSMALIGMEKLKCGRFTSDHWGIYCTFSAEWKSASKTT